MRAGLLRHRITIQQNTPTQDSYGEPVESWGTYATKWARREDMDGREAFEAEQQNAEIITRWTIRYDSGVHAGMRVLKGSDTWDIESVADPTGRGKETVILARKQING